MSRDLLREEWKRFTTQKYAYPRPEMFVVTREEYEVLQNILKRLDRSLGGSPSGGPTDMNRPKEEDS